ncbi:cytochrome P450 [Streptomyces sp. AA0539]|uniref:cytochrome P450 n=1 Tax=Streptomyces sp. AA0539 TaxID=1210045 RepID=UPI0003097ADD|nr:cytochrome P450 [Streptomyces sp. AA0539]
MIEIGTTERTHLPELPLTRQCPYHPPPEYEELRVHGPLTEVRVHDGRRVWAVTHFETSRALLAEPRLSVDRDHPEFPVLVPTLAMAGRRGAPVARALLRTDPPDHTRQRRDVMPSLSLKRVAALRPEIQDVADKRLAALRDGPPRAELVGEFIKPLVSAAITAYLGVPPDERDHLASLAYRRLDPVRGVSGYLDTLLDRPEPPVSGLLGDLVPRVHSGTLQRTELVDYVMSILIAGHDITTSTIALGLLTLLAHNDQLEALRSAPENWPDAVEELLRFLSLTGGLVRVATEDIEVPGTELTIRAGDGVVLLTPAANRDPDRFARPNVLDLRRSARGHLTFGFGVHQCVGQHLARLEVGVALRTLVQGLPATLALAEPVDRTPVRQGLVFSVSALSVTW